MKVLDRGEVSLLNWMGNDLAVIAAARVSNGVEFEKASKGPEADQKLINYLIKHRHGTPFEHATFQFYVKAPLFVVREWQRHRMASYNEISGRYVEFSPEFYYPDKFRIPAATNKQGSVFPVDDEIGSSVDEWNESNRQWVIEHAEQSYAVYENLIANKVAKEMARMVLPLNLYSQFYFTVNARSLMNFLSLRAAEDAQWEIRQYALGMKKIFKNHMPMTFQAWEQNNFIAP